MSQKMKWLSRHSDGRHFPVISSKKLPRLRFQAKKKIVQVNPNELLFREKRPVDFERRVQYFIRLIMQGQLIPPITVWRLPSGRYKVFDGHCRAAAFQRLRIAPIPAVVMKKEPIGKSL